MAKPLWLQKIHDWTNQNPGKVVGIISGILIFLIFTIFGPLVLLFLMLVGGGYIIGKSIDDEVPVLTIIRRILGQENKNNRGQEDFDED